MAPGAPPAATASSAATSASDITCRAGTGCRDGAAVVSCEGDFAHRWPPSATGRVWEFLRAHPLPSGNDG